MVIFLWLGLILIGVIAVGTGIYITKVSKDARKKEATSWSSKLMEVLVTAYIVPILTNVITNPKVLDENFVLPSVIICGIASFLILGIVLYLQVRK